MGISLRKTIIANDQKCVDYKFLSKYSQDHGVVI